MPSVPVDQLPAYDAVIATRNRTEALKLSIPCLLAQVPPPSRLIVIDSSEDHQPVHDLVADLTAEFGGDVVVAASAPGLPHQRNQGLAHVTAPIVLFPDDDSLLHAGAMAEILAVYARDTQNQIAAVGGRPASEPPPGVLGDAWQMTRAHQREAATQGWRNKIEARVAALKPSRFLGQRLNGVHPVPDWLAEMDVVVVDYITGFRMSFRTDAIRDPGFDEALEGYALDEDVDASFQAMRHGLVVAARRALIYHHRFPSGRGDGARLGRMEVLNRIYLGLKHSTAPGLPDGTRDQLERLLRRFILAKLTVALPAARTDHGRARLRGAVSAWRAAGPLWRAAPEDLRAAYREAMTRSARE